MNDHLMEHHQTSGNQRLSQVDALRGLAALAVVLFHFTTRFVELYQPDYTPIFAVPYGYFGVNLFFIVSGFVIFMTLERTEQPMDFVVSRFSRLFPSYWVAIILTFVVTHWLGLPGKLVGFETALTNFLMVHSIFGVPHVDGVYWTLEVEMLFYMGMFSLYRLGRLHQILPVLLGLLALRLLYVVMAKLFGIDLPWIAFRLLILQYIPWFTLGICTYQLSAHKQTTGRTFTLITGGAALLTLLVSESPAVAGLALVFALLVYAATLGRLTVLNARLFLWLGAISYPLYLLHENIGWSVQLQALAHGTPFMVAAALALVVSLTAATALTRWVEQPAMRWIRTRYRERKRTSPA